MNGAANRGLSLQAYLATARGGPVAPSPVLPPRPPGPLVWAWAESAEQGRALTSLCARLQHQHPDVTVVLSGAAQPHAGMIQLTTPPEHLAACASYAAHLRPDVVLWAGLALAPVLLHAFSESGAFMTALDLTDSAPHTPGAPRWLPDPSPATLALFHRLHATDIAAARRLRRMGLERDRVRASAPLLDTDLPLPCADALHEETAEALGRRPVWLAARVMPAEVPQILAAHRQAVRLNHRLLLLLVPADEADPDLIRRSTATAQLRLCHWDSGETPDENTQVLLTEGPEELGLWYRQAPLTFLGGSLCDGCSGHDPFEAAALGTAILYGPNVGAHLTAYSRLVEAGAARIVRDADSLATAVLHLVAPDQAASMAHAGWEVISSGAELVDEVLSEVVAVLDAKDHA